MNVKELRALMELAFREEQLEERVLFPKGPKVWTLPAGDTIRFFRPHAIRRPWGFVYSGAIGIEIPALRRWLQQHKPGDEAGIFRSCFVNYLIDNDQFHSEFMVEHGKPIPTDLWARLLKDRLVRVPATLDDLVRVYLRNREELGWLAHPHMRHAWDFLTKWRENRDPSLHVPKMFPDGRIG